MVHVGMDWLALTWDTSSGPGRAASRTSCCRCRRAQSAETGHTGWWPPWPAHTSEAGRSPPAACCWALPQAPAQPRAASGPDRWAASSCALLRAGPRNEVRVNCATQGPTGSPTPLPLQLGVTGVKLGPPVPAPPGQPAPGIVHSNMQRSGRSLVAIGQGSRGRGGGPDPGADLGQPRQLLHEAADDRRPARHRHRDDGRGVAPGHVRRRRGMATAPRPGGPHHPDRPRPARPGARAPRRPAAARSARAAAVPAPRAGSEGPVGSNGDGGGGGRSGGGPRSPLSPARAHRPFGIILEGQGILNSV